MLREIEKRFKDGDSYTQIDIETNLKSALKGCSYFKLNRTTYRCNELEEKLLECNGTSEEEIDELVNKMLKGLENLPDESMVNGMTIVESIGKVVSMKNDHRINNDLLKRAKAHFLAGNEIKKASKSKEKKDKLNGKSHAFGDVKNSLKQILYELFIKPPGEWDFLVILSSLKILLNIEVKQQDDNLKSRDRKNLNNSLKSASHQCEDHSDYAARVFTPYLGPDWQFVKVAAILPGTLDHDSICDHCDQFIITGKSEEEIQKKINNLRDHLVSTSEAIKEKGANEDFITLTKVLIGLSSISTEHPDSKIAWRQIQGPDSDHVLLSAGWTKSEFEMTPEEMTFKNIG